MPRFASARVIAHSEMAASVPSTLVVSEQIGGRIMNAVLNECLGGHEVEVAGKEVVSGRVGARSKRRSRRAASPPRRSSASG